MNKKIINTEYKYIDEIDDKIKIVHYVLDEYLTKYDDDIVESSYEEYKQYVLSSYLLAEKLNYCKILEITEISIIIEMTKYEVLIDNIEKYKNNELFVEKFYKLLLTMWKNNIIHYDLAPRNIGIDSNGDFQLLDLNELHNIYKINDFIHWIKLFERNFFQLKLGEEYNQVVNKIISKIK